jgi:hypothetical protein
MSRAISAAPGDLKTAKGEVLQRRIAERPSALDLSDLHEPDPPHLTHLGGGENPSLRPSPLANNGRSPASGAGDRASPRDIRQRPPFRARLFSIGPRAPPPPPGNLRRRFQDRPLFKGRRADPVELDPDSIGLADYRVARGRAERCGDPGRASPFEREFLKCLDSLLCPHPLIPLALLETLQIEYRLPLSAQ